MISITSFDHPVPHESLTFSGGERHVRIEKVFADYPETKFEITAKIEGSQDVMELILVTDALRRMYTEPSIHLRCPYLPYARQDRVMEPGESLGLKVMCDIINGLNFKSVEVWDVHSDVGLALLNNVKNYSPESFVQMVPKNGARKIVYVAPDAGAAKKVAKVAKGFKREMVQAGKTRSTVDGSITGTFVNSEHIGDGDFLIVDDICDGGRTFTELGKVLRPLTNGHVNLYVTHGIFSKGFDVFRGIIDHIYVANAFSGVDLTDPIVTKLSEYPR